jgi:hypothetical protein
MYCADDTRRLSSTICLFYDTVQDKTYSGGEPRVPTQGTGPPAAQPLGATGLRDALPVAMGVLDRGGAAVGLPRVRINVAASFHFLLNNIRTGGGGS